MTLDLKALAEKLWKDIEYGSEVYASTHDESKGLIERALQQAADAALEEEAVTWTTVSKNHPQPHAKYLVSRNGHTFVATPCYGMHFPWWVPGVPDGEQDPIEMLDGDLWHAIRALKSDDK